MEHTKILTIGGGSGQFALLSGLRDLKNIEIITVVSMFDSGGSTGRLRDELGTLPPGDILKCILALSPHREGQGETFQGLQEPYPHEEASEEEAGITEGYAHLQSR